MIDTPVDTPETQDKLEEEVEDITTIQPLDTETLYREIEAVTPGTYVNVGYINDVTGSAIAAKYAGGRGSEGNPNVRLMKLTEIYGRCGIDYEEIQAVKDKRAAGIERQGNRYEMQPKIGNKVFYNPSTGKEVLRLYPRSKSDIRTKYFISIDGSEFRPTTKDEFLQYCKASMSAPQKPFDPSAPVNLDLKKIYRFKRLGSSALR